jgi:hypothetical protein
MGLWFDGKNAVSILNLISFAFGLLLKEFVLGKPNTKAGSPTIRRCYEHPFYMHHSEELYKVVAWRIIMAVHKDERDRIAQMRLEMSDVIEQKEAAPE